MTMTRLTLSVNKHYKYYLILIRKTHTITETVSTPVTSPISAPLPAISVPSPKPIIKDVDAANGFSTINTGEIRIRLEENNRRLQTFIRFKMFQLK